MIVKVLREANLKIDRAIATLAEVCRPDYYCTKNDKGEMISPVGVEGACNTSVLTSQEVTDLDDIMRTVNDIMRTVESYHARSNNSTLDKELSKVLMESRVSLTTGL